MDHSDGVCTNQGPERYSSIPRSSSPHHLDDFQQLHRASIDSSTTSCSLLLAEGKLTLARPVSGGEVYPSMTSSANPSYSSGYPQTILPLSAAAVTANPSNSQLPVASCSQRRAIGYDDSCESLGFRAVLFEKGDGKVHWSCDRGVRSIVDYSGLAIRWRQRSRVSTEFSERSRRQRQQFYVLHGLEKENSGWFSTCPYLAARLI